MCVCVRVCLYVCVYACLCVVMHAAGGGKHLRGHSRCVARSKGAKRKGPDRSQGHPDTPVDPAPGLPGPMVRHRHVGDSDADPAAEDHGGQAPPSLFGGLPAGFCRHQLHGREWLSSLHHQLPVQRTRELFKFDQREVENAF